MHDIVIRGGTIVDGTGKAPFSGDVAIAGGRIAAVGGKQGPGKREIDAAGLMVTPGWVDVHTHYDGQAMWDPLLAPSCWHGVTTVMFGNCGVGFAPVKKEHRGALMDLMEGVEEIPNPVLAAGLNWEWETFPQFMDELERRPRAIDICAQAAHLPTRVYVMGDRALRREPATPDDIAEMRKLTVEALRAGAFGFTTSRTDSHKTPDGELVPSRDADDYELLGIGQALGITGTGAFGMNSDFDDEDFELRWIHKQARETGRPVWFLLTDRYSDPQRWRRLIKAVHGMRAEGLPVTAQMAGPADRRDDGHRHRAQSVHGTAELQDAREPADRGAAQAAARSGNAAANSRRDAVGGRDRQARAIPPGGRQGFRKILHHGQSAGLRAGPGEERGGDRQARRPELRGSRLRLHARRGAVPLLPGGELCHRRPRTDPGNAQRSGLPARPERRRRALHVDRRFRRADIHADPLEPRPRARAKTAGGNADQAPDQRDRRFLRTCRIAAGSRRACAPTSI